MPPLVHQGPPNLLIVQRLPGPCSKIPDSVKLDLPNTLYSGLWAHYSPSMSHKDQGGDGRGLAVTAPHQVILGLWGSGFRVLSFAWFHLTSLIRRGSLLTVSTGHANPNPPSVVANLPGSLLEMFCSFDTTKTWSEICSYNPLVRT